MIDERNTLDSTTRRAIIVVRPNRDPDEALREVRAYLPANYRADLLAGGPGDPTRIRVEGEDDAGWTMQDYVIPRLASGNIFADEEVGE